MREKTELEEIIEIGQTSVLEELIEHLEETNDRKLNRYLPVVVRFGKKFYSLKGTECIVRDKKVEVLVIELNKEVDMTEFRHLFYEMYN